MDSPRDTEFTNILHTFTSHIGCADLDLNCWPIHLILNTNLCGVTSWQFSDTLITTFSKDDLYCNTYRPMTGYLNLPIKRLFTPFLGKKCVHSTQFTNSVTNIEKYWLLEYILPFGNTVSHGPSLMKCCLFCFTIIEFSSFHKPSGLH